MARLADCSPITPITEVLREPGGHKLWVTRGAETWLLDLTPLTSTTPGQLLLLPRAWQGVEITSNGYGLAWPGLTLGWTELSECCVQQISPAERYRPLLPYLRAHEPPLWLPPMSRERLQTLLLLRPNDLDKAVRSLGAPTELVYQRLHDIALLLAEYVGHDALLPLLRRPWPVARRLNRMTLLSMQDCLTGGYPHLVERASISLIFVGVT